MLSYYFYTAFLLQTTPWLHVITLAFMVVLSCTLFADLLETCLIALIGLQRGAKWRIAHVQGVVTTAFDLDWCFACGVGRGN